MWDIGNSLYYLHFYVNLKLLKNKIYFKKHMGYK